MQPNPYQPRTDFDREHLDELAHSVQERGVLQPVLVRRRGVNYELIAGERRVRAARRAKLASVPAIVRDAGDQEMLELAIVENEHRANLNPIEAAKAYKRAQLDFGLSTEELADILGRDRSTVANLLRLLKLPDDVQKLVRSGELQAGHGRALIALEDRTQCALVARRVAREQLSVRAVERLVKSLVQPKSKVRARPPQGSEFARFEDRLRQRFATKVRIAQRRGRGRIEIEFYNQDDLERILGELQVLSQG